MRLIRIAPNPTLFAEVESGKRPTVPCVKCKREINPYCAKDEDSIFVELEPMSDNPKHYCWKCKRVLEKEERQRRAKQAKWL